MCEINSFLSHYLFFLHLIRAFVCWNVLLGHHPPIQLFIPQRKRFDWLYRAILDLTWLNLPCIHQPISQSFILSIVGTVLLFLHYTAFSLRKALAAERLCLLLHHTLRSFIEEYSTRIHMFSRCPLDPAQLKATMWWIRSNRIFLSECTKYSRTSFIPCTYFYTHPYDPAWHYRQSMNKQVYMYLGNSYLDIYIPAYRS